MARRSQGAWRKSRLAKHSAPFKIPIRLDALRNATLNPLRIERVTASGIALFETGEEPTLALL